MDPNTRKVVVRSWRVFTRAYNAETEAAEHARASDTYLARLTHLYAIARSVRAQATYVLTVRANLELDVSDWSAHRLWEVHPVNLLAEVQADAEVEEEDDGLVLIAGVLYDAETLEEAD